MTLIEITRKEGMGVEEMKTKQKEKDIKIIRESK
jgi:hypothetical protein